MHKQLAGDVSSGRGCGPALGGLTASDDAESHEAGDYHDPGRRLRRRGQSVDMAGYPEHAVTLDRVDFSNRRCVEREHEV